MSTQSVQVHVFETGRLLGNETFMRGEDWRSLFRRPRPYEFPAQSFVIEHPAGPIAIDTGLSARVSSPRPLLQRRFVPDPQVDEEIGPQMRRGPVNPEDVRTVVLTHLDWDHAGGLAHFPGAEVLVQRPEWAFAQKLPGKLRYEPKLWPESFRPAVYDLDRVPYGPFPESKTVAEDPRVVIVPLAGHTVGQVGVVAELGEVRVLFCADHVLRQNWFREDFHANRLLGLGIWNAKPARETSRRIAQLVAETPTVLIPSHDAEAPGRLARLEPLNL